MVSIIILRLSVGTESNNEEVAILPDSDIVEELKPSKPALNG